MGKLKMFSLKQTHVTLLGSYVHVLCILYDNTRQLVFDTFKCLAIVVMKCAASVNRLFQVSRCMWSIFSIKLSSTFFILFLCYMQVYLCNFGEQDMLSGS